MFGYIKKKKNMTGSNSFLFAIRLEIEHKLAYNAILKY